MKLFRALRMDDVGAASKRHEVYGLTRIPLWGRAVPFPGDFLFLKYLPPIKCWGPYRELSAAEWEVILALLEEAGAKMTVAITAGWVELDGRIIPYPMKFAAAAGVIRQGLMRGLVEIANHGYTHCVLQDRLFRPRLFSGNRQYHREFYDWLPADIHREHLHRSQDILQSYFGTRVETFVPPGNLLSAKTVAAAREVGIRYISCLGAARWSPADGITFVDDARVLAFHDRNLVVSGLGFLRELLDARPGAHLVTVREIGQSPEAVNAR